jgi:predicted HD superfamily hydrolase involved in NAD metabolism
VERASPIIVHGPVAAQILIQDYGFDDGEIIEGIDCHTTARAGMAPVEQVLFIADKVEPHKIKREPALESVRELAKESLEAGVLRFLDLNIEKLLQRRWLLHPKTLEARNDLLRRLKADEERDTKIVE